MITPGKQEYRDAYCLFSSRHTFDPRVYFSVTVGDSYCPGRGGRHSPRVNVPVVSAGRFIKVTQLTFMKRQIDSHIFFYHW